MPRPFRLFSVYDFFSVFIPGLSATFGLYLLIPREIEADLMVILIPTLVFAFVFGQALHAFSAILHVCLPIQSHREKFAEMVASPDPHDEILIKKFKKSISRLLDHPVARRSNMMSKSDWKELYPTVQSQVYSYSNGRSINFQAIYSFSRSMSVLLMGLPIIYSLHHLMQKLGLFQREPWYIELFPSFRRLMEAVTPLCIIGAVLFLLSTYSYQKYFVKYLISDFIVIQDLKEQDSF